MTGKCLGWPVTSYSLEWVEFKTYKRKAPNISTPFSRVPLSLQELTPTFHWYEKQKL